MRYVSENFKAVMNEVIRPPLQLHFEVDTEVFNSVGVFPIFGHDEDLDFDTDVAPIVKPENCLNEKYYAVLGDGKPVDEPNRMCAGGFYPETSVPYGVTPYTAANTEALIGSSEEDMSNFELFDAPTTLSFKGGLIPDVIRVEGYDNDTETWETVTTLYNSELSEEIEYIPEDLEYYRLYRFYVKNTTTAGRFQFNWIMTKYGMANNPPTSPIAFDNNYVASINIDTETDLSSQTLPSYEMTIECLDVDEVYTPDSAYWKNQFKVGTKCFLKIGYEIGEGIEYLPFFTGRLSSVPSYSMGKITFNVSLDMEVWSSEYSSESYDLGDGKITLFSLFDSSAQTGSITKSHAFGDFLDDFFDEHNIFVDADDESNSIFNYYGDIKTSDFRQLTANALGGYIKFDFDKCSLNKTTEIQYQSPIGYVKRNDQVQNTLETQNKISRATVSRTEHTVSSDNVTVSATSSIVMVAHTYVYATFVIPFFAVGRTVITNGDVSNHHTFVTGISSEEIRPDGKVEITLVFTTTQASTGTRTFTPSVTFYRVNDENYQEYKIVNVDSGEEYSNDNSLITNEYTSNKAVAVASFINDISEQYEVDVVQNFCYEIGDIIRLETRKGVYKTCVITGLNFVIPGSSGHITCRRIFSVEDTPEAVLHEIDVRIVFGSEVIKVNHNHTEEDNAFVLGYCTDMSTGKQYLYVLGAHDVNYDEESADACKITITDKNAHDWVLYVVMRLYSPTPPYYDVPYITLPNYDYTQINSGIAYGAIELIKAAYAEQGMNAPVDYDCSYVIE